MALIYNVDFKVTFRTLPPPCSYRVHGNTPGKWVYCELPAPFVVDAWDRNDWRNVCSKHLFEVMKSWR